MSQREELVKVLQSSTGPLTKKQIVDRLPKGFSKKPENYTTALKKLCTDGYVIRNNKNSPHLYSWANKAYVFGQKTKKMKRSTGSKGTGKKGNILEESILRALMSKVGHPMTKQDIGSLIHEAPSSLDKPLKRLEGKGYVSTTKKGGQTYYQLTIGSIKVVYLVYLPNNAGNNIIDVVSTLKNYKNNLSSIYMNKPRIDFDLELLKKVSGFDLTAKGTVKKATFQKHVELKEKLKSYINGNNTEKIFYWIVYAWGGIKENENSSVSTFVDDYVKANGNGEVLLESFAGRQERVASWSKILSFLYPHDYFIYDARVAFTLDFLYGRESFPVPPGDNTLINEHVGRRRQPTLDEYKEYCSLIKKIHPQVWSTNEEGTNVPYYMTEMLIFSLLNDIGFKACIPENFKLF